MFEFVFEISKETFLENIFFAFYVALFMQTETLQRNVFKRISDFWPTVQLLALFFQAVVNCKA